MTTASPTYQAGNWELIFSAFLAFTFLIPPVTEQDLLSVFLLNPILLAWPFSSLSRWSVNTYVMN